MKEQSIESVRFPGEELIRLDSLKRHPENPRTITDDALEELKVSIQELSEMFELRPIAYDEDRVIWGGNQRHLGLEMLGYEEIPKKWTKEMIGWPLAKKKAFAIKDNVPMGEWDNEKLKDEYWKEYAYEYGDEDMKSFLKHVEFDASVPSEDINTSLEKRWMLNVETRTEEQTQKLYEEMLDRGFDCKIIT